MGRGGINLSAIITNAVPQEVILQWFFCDEYSAAGLLPLPLVPVQNMVPWDGTSPELPQGRTPKGTAHFFRIHPLGSFSTSSRPSGSTLHYIFVSPVSAPQLHFSFFLFSFLEDLSRGERAVTRDGRASTVLTAAVLCGNAAGGSVSGAGTENPRAARRGGAGQGRAAAAAPPSSTAPQHGGLRGGAGLRKRKLFRPLRKRPAGSDGHG